MPTINGFGSTAVDDKTIETNGQGQLKQLNSYNELTITDLDASLLSSGTSQTKTDDISISSTITQGRAVLLLYCEVYIYDRNYNDSGYSRENKTTLGVGVDSVDVFDNIIYERTTNQGSNSADFTHEERRTFCIPLLLDSDQQANGITLNMKSKVDRNYSPANQDIRQNVEKLVVIGM